MIYKIGSKYYKKFKLSLYNSQLNNMMIEKLNKINNKWGNFAIY